MTKHLDIFSTFISQTRFSDIPADTVSRAKLIIADCVGAIVGGSAEPEILAFTSSIKTSGTSRILGSSNLTDPQTASLINGTAGTVLEMDEGHQFARGPACTSSPRCLRRQRVQLKQFQEKIF